MRYLNFKPLVAALIFILLIIWLVLSIIGFASGTVLTRPIMSLMISIGALLALFLVLDITE